LKITGRQAQAKVNGRKPKAEKQAGKGECFEPHPDLRAGTNNADKKRIGYRYGGHGYSGSETDQHRQQEQKQMRRHMGACEKLYHAADGAAGFEIELKKQRAENQQDHVGLAGGPENRQPAIKGNPVYQQQSDNGQQDTDSRRQIKGNIQAGSKYNRPEGMEQILQVVTRVTFDRFVLRAFRRDSEHQQYKYAEQATRTCQGDVVAKERQGRDTEQALNKRHYREERPDRFPKMTKKIVNGGEPASLDADLVAGLAEHRRRQHDAAGRWQHPHHQRYQCQGKPAAPEQTLHGRDKPLRKADFFHRRTDDVHQQQQSGQ